MSNQQQDAQNELLNFFFAELHVFHRYFFLRTGALGLSSPV